VKFSMDIVTKPYRPVQITPSHDPSMRGDYSKPNAGQPHMAVLRTLCCGFGCLLFGKGPEISITCYRTQRNADDKLLIVEVFWSQIIRLHRLLLHFNKSTTKLNSPYLGDATPALTC